MKFKQFVNENVQFTILKTNRKEGKDLVEFTDNGYWGPIGYSKGDIFLVERKPIFPASWKVQQVGTRIIQSGMPMGFRNRKGKSVDIDNLMSGGK